MNHKPIPPALRASTITVLQSFCDSQVEDNSLRLTICIFWTKLPDARALQILLDQPNGLWRR
jgi:hypothetical protein